MIGSVLKLLSTAG